MLEDGTTTDWIPLKFFATTLNIFEPHIGIIQSDSNLTGDNLGQFTLRGYRFNYIIQNQSDDNFHHSISLCGGDILQQPLQFRWLQNSYQRGYLVRDVVLLDNVTVRVKNGTHYAVLLQDSFDSLR